MNSDEKLPLNWTEIQNKTPRQEFVGCFLFVFCQTETCPTPSSWIPPRVKTPCCFCTTELWQRHHWSSPSQLCRHRHFHKTWHFAPPYCRQLKLLQRQLHISRRQIVSSAGLCPSVNKAFQVLVCIPIIKFILDPFDKLNQDFGGLDQVFQTVPLSNWYVTASIWRWSHINLQKPD